MLKKTLPKTRKLAAKAEFDRVFGKPDIRLKKHPFLVLASRSEYSQARLGMVVGKRNAKRAVDRNRIRRHIRETFRLHPGLPAYDVVILARSGVDQCERADLNKILEALWQRLNKQGSRIFDQADVTTGEGSV